MSVLEACRSTAKFARVEWPETSCLVGAELTREATTNRSTSALPMPEQLSIGDGLAARLRSGLFASGHGRVAGCV